MHRRIPIALLTPITPTPLPAGHSLGGSLATVLMLLFVYRQLLAPGQVAQVHTFGAPAVFCNLLGFGASPSASYSGAATAGGASASAGRYLGDAFGSVDGSASGGASSSGDSLLSQLGLSEGVVHNVIMHRDIVPRAFVCDYTLVSGILQQWMPSFKDHTGARRCLPRMPSHRLLCPPPWQMAWFMHKPRMRRPNLLGVHAHPGAVFVSLFCRVCCDS